MARVLLCSHACVTSLVLSPVVRPHNGANNTNNKRVAFRLYYIRLRNTGEP